MVLCPLHLDRTAKANEIRVTAASMILATCGPWSEVELRDAIAENAEVLEPQVDPVVIRRGDVELHLGAIETREGALLAVSLQAADPPAAGD